MGEDGLKMGRLVSILGEAEEFGKANILKNWFRHKSLKKLWYHKRIETLTNTERDIDEWNTEREREMNEKCSSIFHWL
jgi:hypothetical protein